MTAKNNFVIVEDLWEEKPSLIFIPPKFRDKHTSCIKGKVLSVSKKFEKSLSSGDTVLYSKNAGIKIELDKQVLRAIPFQSIMAAKTL